MLEDMSAKLADAYARGREQGLAEGRVEASDRHAAELAAARELAETHQREFRLNEFAELEGAIRSGFKQIEDNVGGAVTRILAPFLSQQVVKRAVDELANHRVRSKFVDPSGCLRSCASESPTCRSRSNMWKMTALKPSSRQIQRRSPLSFAHGPNCWPPSRLKPGR